MILEDFKMKTFSSGQLAKKAGVHIETIRFYERRGLIPKMPRTGSGYRTFSDESVTRIQFIKGAQMVGFTLKEIQDLFSLRVDPKTSCGNIKKRAEIKISEIDSKILALKKMRKALFRLKHSCRGRGPTSECPILEALDRRGGKIL